MENLNNLFSFDPTKVWSFTTKENIKIYNKITNDYEYKNLLQVKKFLNDKKINIFGKLYKINVPEILNWDSQNKIMSTIECEGVNLEFILRSKNEEYRKLGVKILNRILFFCLSNNFYWVDFAPRNIIINNNEIFIMDFEKGISFEDNNLKKYFRNHVYEEYSSFILPEENMIDEEFVFTLGKEEENKILKVNKINAKRIQSVIKKLGYKDYINLSEYYNAFKILIFAEKPFLENHKIYFPRIELHNFLERSEKNEKAYMKYGEKVLTLYNKKREGDSVEI